VRQSLGVTADDLFYSVAHGTSTAEKRAALLGILNATAPGTNPLKYLTAETADAMSPELAKRFLNDYHSLPPTRTRRCAEAGRRYKGLVDADEADKLAGSAPRRLFARWLPTWTATRSRTTWPATWTKQPRSQEIRATDAGRRVQGAGGAGRAAGTGGQG